jgi:hypothetical protein
LTNFSNCSCAELPGFRKYTIDCAIDLDGVVVLLENKNLVFLGTSTEKGYDPLPFATGTSNIFKNLLKSMGK